MKDRTSILVSLDAGLGDLHQARCVLHDLKLAHPYHKLVFGTSLKYFDAIRCHPAITEVVDINNTDPDNFTYWYALSRPCSQSCIQGENTIDYYATSLGIKITDYDMRFRLTDEEVDFALGLTQGKPTIGLAPISSTLARNLTPEARRGVCEALLASGWQVVLLHSNKLPELPREVLQPSLELRQLIAVWHQCKAAICVDTSHLHLVGGIGLPTVGIFATQCGWIYSRRYKQVRVIQQHPVGTKCQTPDITGVTAEEILEQFRQLEIK